MNKLIQSLLNIFYQVKKDVIYFLVDIMEGYVESLTNLLKR